MKRKGSEPMYSTLTVRISKVDRERFRAACKALGMTPSDAVQGFYRRTIAKAERQVKS